MKADGKAKWSFLKTISNCALVIMPLLLVLHWYNDGKFEAVVNDPIAKQYWIEVRHFYDLIGLILIAALVVPRLCYWTIEYFYDRRSLSLGKGKNSQTLP